jgi:predicted nucleic acid-binding protein
VTVIADTSPLQYAVEIDVAPTLFMLYGRIVIPPAVSSELRHPSAPLLLRRWVVGEREAIVLAQLTPGSLLIIDDGDGRNKARRRGLRITGLLGVIRDAALRGLVDFDDAIQRLRNTDFRLSPEAEALVRRQ